MVAGAFTGNNRFWPKQPPILYFSEDCVIMSWPHRKTLIPTSSPKAALQNQRFMQATTTTVLKIPLEPAGKPFIMRTKVRLKSPKSWGTCSSSWRCSEQEAGLEISQGPFQDELWPTVWQKMSRTPLLAICFSINGVLYFCFPTNLQYTEAGMRQSVSYTFNVDKENGKPNYSHTSKKRILHFNSNWMWYK